MAGGREWSILRRTMEKDAIAAIFLLAALLIPRCVEGKPLSRRERASGCGTCETLAREQGEIHFTRCSGKRDSPGTRGNGSRVNSKEVARFR